MFTENGGETFQNDSGREARRISRERALAQSYQEFFQTPEGRNFSRKFGRTYSDSVPRMNGTEPEFRDPADLPVCKYVDHPVDHFEPQDGHITLRGMDREEIFVVCQTFYLTFRWALDGAQSANGDSPLVCVGKRSNVILARMRPDLGAGLILKTSLCRAFDRRFSEITLLRTGVRFGRVLEWIRRANTLSERGEHVYDLAYGIWPADIDGATLSALGKMSDKTRQARDKRANSLRGTFKNIKAPSMRANVTRLRCRESQFAFLQRNQ